MLNYPALLAGFIFAGLGVLLSHLSSARFRIWLAFSLIWIVTAAIGELLVALAALLINPLAMRGIVIAHLIKFGIWGFQPVLWRWQYKRAFARETRVLDLESRVQSAATPEEAASLQGQLAALLAFRPRPLKPPWDDLPSLFPLVLLVVLYLASVATMGRINALFDFSGSSTFKTTLRSHPDQDFRLLFTDGDASLSLEMIDGALTPVYRNTSAAIELIIKGPVEQLRAARKAIDAIRVPRGAPHPDDNN